MYPYIWLEIMNTNIAKLSEIEKAAEAIVKNAESEKASLEKAMQEKRDIFDADMENSTNQKVSVIRGELKEKMARLLEQQRSSNSETIKQLEKDFEKNHSEYAKTIFERIIEV